MKTRDQKKQFISIAIICMVLIVSVFPALAEESTTEEEKVFVIHAPIRDLGEFRILAEQAARLTAVEQISALKAEIGDLNKVERIMKVLGMVNADPSFTNHSQ